MCMDAAYYLWALEHDLNMNSSPTHSYLSRAASPNGKICLKMPRKAYHHLCEWANIWFES